MRGVGIVTDASAHFLPPSFAEHPRVHMLPLPILWEGQRYLPPSSALTTALPPSLIHRTPPRFLVPPAPEIAQHLRYLMPHYDALLLLPMGSSLSGFFQHCTEAAALLGGGFPIYIVDTHTTGIGLGWLVQKAARMAETGAAIFDILTHIRGMVGHIYTALGALSLTYLYHHGFLEPGQAIIGEMLEMLPLFVLEEGRLAPLQKARSSRHLLDLMEEFTLEFSTPAEVVITYHPRYFRREAGNLHDRLLNNLPFPPKTTEMDTVSAALFGPRTLGLYVLTGQR